MMKKFFVALIASMALSPAFAVLTFTLSENAGDVVLTASGSLDTTGLVVGSPFSCSSLGGVISAGRGSFCVGAGLGVDYVGSAGAMTGPTSIGSGGDFFATSTSGDTVFLIRSSGGRVALPLSYVSGSPVSGTATFAGATLASLGVTPGTYTWTLPTGGGSAESIVLLAGAPATSVPTLGEYALLALAGLLVLGTLPMLRGRT